MIIQFFSILFPLRFFRFLDRKFNLIYTYWISREFKKLNGSVYFAFPLYLNGGKNIVLGKNFDSDQRLRLDTYDNFLGEKFSPLIEIGDNVSIQKDCHIGAINRITIGNNVLIGSRVFISDHSHGEINSNALRLPPAQRSLYSKGEVVIEDNVWIGEGVVVLPGVTIGENSIIGANAVVSKSIPKNTVAAGNPARVIKEIN
nr:acyltransferase [Pedobacter cryoconitis]